MPSDRLSKDHTHDRVHATYLVTLGIEGDPGTPENGKAARIIQSYLEGSKLAVVN